MQINYKVSFIKGGFQRFRQHFKCTSHWLFFGRYILNRTTKNAWKNCLKELAINIAASKISKNSAFIFLSYFKNKYFLELLTMITYGNVTKFVVLHQYEQYIWYIGI